MTKELKNGIEIFGRSSSFQVMDQNNQNIVLIQLKNHFADLNFKDIFVFLEQFYYEMSTLFLIKYFAVTGPLVSHAVAIHDDVN